MPSTLRPLGSAWQPLLDSSVDALERGGLDMSRLWPTRAERQAALERLSALLDLVVTWNARIDLTAARSERELVDLYLADALLLAAHGARLGAGASRRWVDVGSGAGAPGLALGLLWLEPGLTLVEPRRKRVAFLRNASGRFPAVRPPRIIDGRSDVVQAWSHDVAISRATFSPEEWLKEGARLALQGVWVLLARAAPPSLAGWTLAEHIDYEWPLTQVARSALLFTRAGARAASTQPASVAASPTPPSEGPASPASPASAAGTEASSGNEASGKGTLGSGPASTSGNGAWVGSGILFRSTSVISVQPAPHAKSTSAAPVGRAKM